MTAAEMTLKAKRGVAFKGNCTDILSADVPPRAGARSNKETRTLLWIVKDRGLFFSARQANRDAQVSFSSFLRTDAGRFINALIAHSFLRKISANQNWFPRWPRREDSTGAVQCIQVCTLASTLVFRYTLYTIALKKTILWKQSLKILKFIRIYTDIYIYTDWIRSLVFVGNRLERRVERERTGTSFLTDGREQRDRDFRVNILVKVIATYRRRTGVFFILSSRKYRCDDEKKRKERKRETGSTTRQTCSERLKRGNLYAFVRKFYLKFISLVTNKNQIALSIRTQMSRYKRQFFANDSIRYSKKGKKDSGNTFARIYVIVICII